MRTTIEMAREAAGDDWGLFQEYMPEIHRLAELVRADERAQRKPLTDEQIIASNYPDGEENGPTIAAPDFELICFARQIEAAHGIKENT